ncbi:MFS transporter [Actinoplanes flavus]|uniref:MFS transporter n=1 Tax=Actinoplanes flavus TaxID=2820290 RepID=A0ABS3UI47_9ACTN|nr:MFS transporter [Actinoplanes flavus]MBO3738116.1 MFS transporter [Actinoplanes flavus]
MSGRTGYLALLRNRDYTLLWSGQVTSSIGDAIYEVALIWLVLGITDQSYAAVGLVLGVRLGAGLLSGPFAGVYADRWPRKTILVAGDVVRGLLLLVLPLSHVTVGLEVWHVAVVAGGLTIARTFFNPSLQASIPQLIASGQLASANAFLHAAMQTMYVVGPAAAGLALAHTSALSLLVVDTVTFFVSAATIAALRLPHHRPKDAPRTTVLHDLVDMVRQVYRIPTVFWSIVLFAVGLLAVAGTQRIGMPALADEVLGGGATEFGLLMSAVGAGTVAGSLVIGRINYRSDARMMFLGWVAWGLCFTLLGLSGHLWIAIAIAALAGAAEGVTDVCVTTLLQKSVPDHQLGRVFSLFSLTAAAGDAGSSIIIGQSLRRWNTVGVFVVSGLVAAGVGLAGVIVSRRWPNPEPEPPALREPTPPTPAVNN